MTKLHITAACAIAALTLAACTQEETDRRQPQTARHPITVTAEWQPSAAGTPSTRVVDSGSGDAVGSSWTDGDKIRVSVSSLSTGSSMSTSCTMRYYGIVTAYDPQLYWQTAGRHAVNAWYSNIEGCATTDRTVSLADQSAALAYVLKAVPDTCVYALKRLGDIPLTFVHQLAKVRVKLSAASGSTADPTAASVKLRQCFTSCTVDGGRVIPSGKADGEVTMMPPGKADGFFEANVIPDLPGTARQTDAVVVSLGGNTSTRSLSRPITLEAGKMYTLHFTIK